MTEEQTNKCPECGHIRTGDEPCPNVRYCKTGWRGHWQIRYDEACAALPGLIADLDADDGTGEDLSELVRDMRNTYDHGISAGLLARDALIPLDTAVYGWQERRRGVLERRAADASVARKAKMPPILCRGVNVAEHVAAMFDALVGSLDWGSGFLDTETIESILIVAELAGFDVPSVDVPLPGHDGPYDDQNAKAEAVAAWRAQVQAKARAMIEGAAAEDGGSPP